MQTVATLGDWSVKPEEEEEKATRKHSWPSSTESEVMETETH